MQASERDDRPRARSDPNSATPRGHPLFGAAPQMLTARHSRSPGRYLLAPSRRSSTVHAGTRQHLPNDFPRPNSRLVGGASDPTPLAPRLSSEQLGERDKRPWRVSWRSRVDLHVEPQQHLYRSDIIKSWRSRHGPTMPGWPPDHAWDNPRHDRPGCPQRVRTRQHALPALAASDAALAAGLDLDRRAASRAVHWRRPSARRCWCSSRHSSAGWPRSAGGFSPGAASCCGWW